MNTFYNETESSPCELGVCSQIPTNFETRRLHLTPGKPAVQRSCLCGTTALIFDKVSLSIWPTEYLQILAERQKQEDRGESFGQHLPVIQTPPLVSDFGKNLKTVKFQFSFKQTDDAEPDCRGHCDVRARRNNKFWLRCNVSCVHRELCPTLDNRRFRCISFATWRIPRHKSPIRPSIPALCCNTHLSAFQFLEFRKHKPLKLLLISFHFTWP